MQINFTARGKKKLNYSVNIDIIIHQNMDEE